MKVTFIPGPQKLKTLKIIREKLQIGLKEAKDCVDAGEFECTAEQFKSIEPKLTEIGNSGFEVMH